MAKGVRKKTANKKESALVTEFTVMCKVKLKCFVYNVHETAYGDCGFPDMVVHPTDSALTYFVEAKRHMLFEQAEKAMRPAQRAMFMRMTNSDMFPVLLWKTGCALMRKQEWIDVVPGYESEGFYDVRECMFNPKFIWFVYMDQNGVEFDGDKNESFDGFRRFVEYNSVPIKDLTQPIVHMKNL